MVRLLIQILERLLGQSTAAGDRAAITATIKNRTKILLLDQAGHDEKGTNAICFSLGTLAGLRDYSPLPRIQLAQ
jgi:hypothetical protein